ncbi:type 1 glutamine amidotransferase domain-containing protein [Pseudoalteromonas piscicida]|uniref:Type 1 glutamine amidotransferase domain-containing protein n=1 Tax=Pseudoalteromonas piscicida TaxID=43662 RepID=A0AAD0RN00_PSEO7|nr:type 1 glutamine amidotransferase domain-containing protein [Pseudoalteromonas piscicida]AXR01463.1 type 1 glutamine amidotransferase domain-containing protein [Pseudoalteromonas piscicida]
MTAKKILMVLTSHAELGNTGEKTGFWVEEFAAPYYAFVDAGVEITLASPKGGQPPIDPKSEQPDFQTDSTKRYFDDEKTQELVANTVPLAEVSAADFDAVFYPGGHGPLWDLATDENSIQLISAFLAADKPVGTVCHATAVLIDVKTVEGEYLVNGKTVSGFTNSEEAAVGLTDVVPFLLEDELVKRGADFQKVDDWNTFAVRDGLLFTGQNPASSELVAEKLLTYLNQ